MGQLIRIILIVIVVLWVVRRLLGTILGTPKKAEAPDEFQDAPNNMVKDPICGMYMDSRLALRLEKQKEAFYFCSEECKNRYLGKSREGKAAAAPPA